MKRLIILALLISAGCTTPNRGPCVVAAERYAARHIAYGQPTGIVYYFLRGDDGIIELSQADGKFMSHAINYQDRDGQRTYIDPSCNPPKVVREPSATSLFYDSGKDGTPQEQYDALLRRLTGGAESH